MEEMFSCCKELEELNIYNFNFTNVKNIKNIFFGCKSLKKINLSIYQIPYLNNEIIKDCSRECKISTLDDWK